MKRSKLLLCLTPLLIIRTVIRILITLSLIRLNGLTKSMRNTMRISVCLYSEIPTSKEILLRDFLIRKIIAG